MEEKILRGICGCQGLAILTQLKTKALSVKVKVETEDAKSEWIPDPMIRTTKTLTSDDHKIGWRKDFKINVKIGDSA